MSRARDHYESLLAERYSWMHGDFAARRRTAAEGLRQRGIAGRRAIDLGAGAGCHTLALVDLGFVVRAIDFSPTLVAELARRTEGTDVEVMMADVMDFGAWGEPADVIVCMGDTLTHLPSFADVRALIGAARERLVVGGRLVLEYRDLSVERVGLDRFVSVRSEADRIFTCFLEYGPEHVEVHDLVHERTERGWELTKSAYPKLRLAEESVKTWIAEAGLSVVAAESIRGLVTIVARRGGPPRE